MALSGIFCRHGHDLLRQEGLHAMLLHKTQRVQRRAGRTLTRFRGECAIKKKNETPQNLSPSMCTCVTVDIVRHSSLDPIAPTDIHGPTTTKVSAGIVTEGSRTAAITAKRNHMWTKVNCVRDRKRACGPTEFTPRPPRGREQHGLNWAFCTLSIELEIETAKSKRCEKMMWKAFRLGRSSWIWPKAAVWPAVSHMQRWQWNTQNKGRTLHHSLRSLEKYFTSSSESGGEVVARGD